MRLKIKRPTTDPVKARTRQMYATLKRRAGDTSVMTLEQFRAFYACASPLCPYCNVTLHSGNISLDHLLPVSRGGDHKDVNLTFCCQSCNKAKGNRTAWEFKDLIRALDEIGAHHRNLHLRDEVLGDLMRAASFKLGANRRAKK